MGRSSGLIQDVGGSPVITHVTPEGPIPNFSAAQERSNLPLASAKLLFPAVASKIVCVGRNYSEHAKELGNEVPSEPPTSSSLQPLISPGEKIVRPRHFSQRVEFEGELTVVIGKKCRNLGPNDDVLPDSSCYLSDD